MQNFILKAFVYKKREWKEQNLGSWAQEYRVSHGLLKIEHS